MIPYTRNMDSNSPMFDTNLSKIRSKLRTSGAVTGNFGKAKVKARSPLAEIGETKAEIVKIAPREEYIRRMLRVLETTPDPKLREFAYFELHRLNCFQEHRLPATQQPQPFKGPKGSY